EPPRPRAPERAAGRRRGPHAGGCAHHRRRPGRRAVRPPGVVVDRSRGRHRGGARDRAGGLPDPGAHRPGARGPARAADRRDQTDRGNRARSKERLRHPLARAVGPALRRSHHRRLSKGRRRRGARDRGPGGGTTQTGPAAPRSHGPRRAMLNALNDDQRSRIARRPPRSLKQEYQEFLLQRIEEYKNTLSREELLEIGDEAVRELEESSAGQYLLTEVLLLEHVDRIIARRLRLPAFPRWRLKHSWLPDVAPSLVVLDPAALAPARARDRNAVIADLKTRTPPGGVHVVLASATAREVIPLAPEALQAQYGGWHIARRRRTKAGAGFTATKPERQVDTAVNVSD